MQYKDVDIDPAVDHMEKYNRGKNAIEQANKKMLEINKLQSAQAESVVESTPEKPKTIMKDYAGGQIKIVPKTNKEYDEIWKAFLEVEPEFAQYMGYGKRVIGKLGKKNFIDYMGWNHALDINKWKTNILHVIPCVHCKQNFTTVQQDFGLCPKCAKEYEIDRFVEMITANEQAEPGSSNAIRIMFLYDADFRSKYLKKTLDQRIQGCVAENFEGFDTYRILKDMITEADGDVDKVKEDLYAKICGYKDYDLFVDKLDETFAQLNTVDETEDMIAILQDIYLPELEGKKAD